jgi:hypothetical protein
VTPPLVQRKSPASAPGAALQSAEADFAPCCRDFSRQARRHDTTVPAPRRALVRSPLLLVGAVLPLALVAAAAPALVRAFPHGAPPGFTGGFGQPDCSQCHFDDATADTRAVRVILQGAPEAYTPGALYRLTVRVEDGAMRAAGFQLAARFAEGPQERRTAGTLRPVGPGVATVQDGSGVLYAGHDAPQPAEDGAAAWTVEWQAPAAPGHAVAFHVAALAADGDGSQFGDVVRTAERIARARRAFK